MTDSRASESTGEFFGEECFHEMRSSVRDFDGLVPVRTSFVSEASGNLVHLSVLFHLLVEVISTSGVNPTWGKSDGRVATGIPLRLFSGPNTTAYFGRPLRYISAAGTQVPPGSFIFFGRIPSLRICLLLQAMYGSSRRVSPDSSLLRRALPFPAFVLEFMCGSQLLPVIVCLIPVDDLLDYDGFNVIVAPTRRRHDPAVPAVVPMSSAFWTTAASKSSWRFPWFSMHSWVSHGSVLMGQSQDKWVSLRRSVVIVLSFAIGGRAERLSDSYCGAIT